MAPDSNPYLVMLAVFKSGIDGQTSKIANLRQAERYLPDNIYTALEDFRNSTWATKLLGESGGRRWAGLDLGLGEEKREGHATRRVGDPKTGAMATHASISPNRYAPPAADVATGSPLSSGDTEASLERATCIASRAVDILVGIAYGVDR